MTQTALMQQKELSLVESTAREIGMSDSELQLTKDVYAKGATDQEFSLFLKTAHRLGLNPLARQIYLVKRYDSTLGREVATPQTSIDGFRLIADRTERYVPGRETTFEYDAQGGIKSATAYVKKFVAGTWHEISATAYFTEYAQTKKDGTLTQMWKTKPHIMIAKCAESLALRKAFPAELSGIYTQEEMGQAENPAPSYQPPTKGQLVAQHSIETSASEAVEGEVVIMEPETVSISDLCKQLKAAGDPIEWSGTVLLEYANQLLDSDYTSLEQLNDEQRQMLHEDLELRLEELSK